jgi:peptidoglycan/LPS O-acetylase OafA/YrhL
MTGDMTRDGEHALPGTIAELTSVRFFAAWFVVLFHIHDHTPLLAQLPTSFFLKGYLGVDVFFILSGFILSHVYLAPWREGRFSYGPFMVNRFARVYPLHLFMTLAFVALYSVASRVGFIENPDGMSWSALPAHLAAVHAWGFLDHHAWNFPSWSISAEFFAYLIFPLLLAFTRIGAWAGLALATAVLTVAYFVCEAIGRPLTALTFDFGIARIFVEFALGVFLYLACLRVALSSTTAKMLAFAATLLFVVLAHFGAADLPLILIAGVIIFLLGQMARGERPSLMRAKPFVYLGEISYSTYMIHLIAQLVLVKLAARMLGVPEDGLPLYALLGLIAAILVGSMLSFHLIEVPARNALRRLMHERHPREWRANS